MNIMIKLNNQLYERRLEQNPRKERYLPQGQPKYDRTHRTPQYQGEPLELNATYKRKDHKGRQEKKDLKKHRIKCYK